MRHWIRSLGIWPFESLYRATSVQDSNTAYKHPGKSNQNRIKRHQGQGKSNHNREQTWFTKPMQRVEISPRGSASAEAGWIGGSDVPAPRRTKAQLLSENEKSSRATGGYDPS